MPRQPLIDIIAIGRLYEMIREIPGDIYELGVLQGRHLAQFATLRGAFEPLNMHRRIVGFDTFEGFASIDNLDIDNRADATKFRLPSSHLDHMRAVLAIHSRGQESVELVQGDVCESVVRYLETAPGRIIAFAYFDLDLFCPTKSVLEAIVSRLTRGSLLAFDELNHWQWPGETVALRETLGLDSLELKYVVPGASNVTYARWEK
jgi:hypothetical protein